MADTTSIPPIPGDDASLEAFVVRVTAPARPPLVPELELHLASEVLPVWQATEAEAARIGLPPPFWAFAWAGGQALARYVLDHPQIVRGRRVLDLASGSGLVAIAAMKAGAASAVANDIDRFAMPAIALNAAANGVALERETLDRLGPETAHEPFGTVLAGDIFYERDTAARVLHFLQRMKRDGARILVGDPGRSYLPKDKMTVLAAYEVPVIRDLEDAEIKRAKVWTLSG